MKRIKLLATGGTIVSQQGGEGLVPGLHADGLLRYLRELPGDLQIDHEDLFHLDSSNIQPEEWQTIARSIWRDLARYDGFVITHGTDTMAYTAAALSFMLQGLDRAVVLTGSQVPIGEPLTDARTNLYTAISAIERGMCGVMVAFDRKVINGTRAVKSSTMGFDSFISVNAGYMAQVFADGLRLFSRDTATGPQTAPALRDDLCTDVFLLKLIPGTNPAILDALACMNYRGLVIEAFGAGGIHYLGRDLLEKLRMLHDRGIMVVVCSQCLYDHSDLRLYEVGRRMLSAGAVSAMDMTTEAAVTKLMWALGQTADPDAAAALFSHNVAGELAADERGQ